MSWFSDKLVQLQTLFSTQSDMVSKKTPDLDLSSLKVVELRTLAKKKGLKGYTALRKAELIKMLQQN